MVIQGYARPELLAETEWLTEHLGDANLRIVDCDSPDAYNRTHIPGAVNVGTNSNVKGEDGASAHVMPPDEAAEFMSGLGIGDDTLVVAYDNRNSVGSARFWWVLNYYGHTNVKVLNGGWRKWLAEDRPVTDRASAAEQASFTPRVDESLIVKSDGLKSAIGQEGVAIWDVRSRGEYTGEASRGNKYTGHVPGCAYMEWTGVMDTDGLATFKPAEEIRRMLSEIGVTPDKQVYTY
jgi:thiosulfate/3-mercaptopyruvate sulfurtransferase